MLRAALELCQADVLGWPTVAVRAICRTGWSSIARTLARETIPNAACKVRRRAGVGVHGLNVIHVIALAGARALLAVVCVTDPEVHTLLHQTCRSSHLHVVAQDPRDAELRRVRDHHLMLQVPHDSCQVRCVDVLWWIARVALGPVHVEAVERAIAGADRRRGRWRGRRGCRRRLAFVCVVCAAIAVAGTPFIALATALPRIGAATSLHGTRGRCWRWRWGWCKSMTGLRVVPATCAPIEAPRLTTAKLITDRARNHTAHTSPNPNPTLPSDLTASLRAHS